MADCPTVQVPNKQRRWFAVLLGQGSELPLWYLARRRWRMCWSRSGRIADPGGGAVDGSNADSAGDPNRLEQSSTEEAREADEIDEDSRA